MAKRLTFTEFSEFVLARLYELEGEGSASEFHDVSAIAAELAEPVPERWHMEVVAPLAERGLVFDGGGFGSAEAAITGAGRLHVEQAAREKDSIVHEYRHSPLSIVNIYGGVTGGNLALGNVGDVSQTSISGDTRDQVAALLRQVEETLQQDSALNDEEREEALRDVRAAQEQMERREPNRHAVLALLKPLAHVASVGSLVIKVGELLAG